MVQPRQASIPGTAGPGDGVVMIESPSGSHEWYRGDKRHRENGPALERADGVREWLVNGELHREDGPAVERADGTREWWEFGERYHRAGPE